MAYDPVKQVWDDVESYSPEADMPAVGSYMVEQVNQGKMPVMNEQAIYAALQKEAMAQKARQQGILEQMAKREQEYAASNKGMSPTEKAALMFQAAGALAAPTRTGAFGESLGALGTAISGPLLKQAEADRARQEKLLQLQMAREKMAMEMPSGEVSAADMLKLYQLQQAAKKSPETFKLEEVDGQPVLVGSQGTIRPVDRAAAGLGAAPKEGEEGRLVIPPEIQSMGSDAVKKFRERMGTKMADTIDAAEQGAERARRIQPIFERAEQAYKTLDKMGAIGNIQGKPEGWSRKIAATFGTSAEQVRQDYEQAAAELQAFKSELLKGQGAITDFERKLLATTLPKLDAVNGKPGLRTLDFLRDDLRSTIERPDRYRRRGSTEDRQPEPSRAERTPAQTSERPAAKPQVNAPAAAIEALRKNPNLREQFDKKYGAGASASVLGE